VRTLRGDIRNVIYFFFAESDKKKLKNDFYPSDYSIYINQRQKENHFLLSQHQGYRVELYKTTNWPLKSRLSHACGCDHEVVQQMDMVTL